MVEIFLNGSPKAFFRENEARLSTEKAVIAKGDDTEVLMYVRSGKYIVEAEKNGIVVESLTFFPSEEVSMKFIDSDVAELISEYVCREPPVEPDEPQPDDEDADDDSLSSNIVYEDEDMRYDSYTYGIAYDLIEALAGPNVAEFMDVYEVNEFLDAAISCIAGITEPYIV